MKESRIIGSYTEVAHKKRVKIEKMRPEGRGRYGWSTMSSSGEPEQIDLAGVAWGRQGWSYATRSGGTECGSTSGTPAVLDTRGRGVQHHDGGAPTEERLTEDVHLCIRDAVARGGGDLDRVDAGSEGEGVFVVARNRERRKERR